MHRGLVVLACALVTVACTSSQQTQPTPRPQDRLIIGTAAPSPETDPVSCRARFCAYTLLPNVYEGLVELEGTVLEPTPLLAEDWTVSEDGTTYTFSLRSGVTFSDGTSFTAEHVRTSWERVDDLGSAEVSAPDERTIVVTLPEPDTAFLHRLALPSRAIVHRGAGTGPYDLSDDLRLERRAGYWGEAAAIGEVVFRRLDPERIISALGTGNMDVGVHAWEPSDVARLRDAEGVETVQGPGAAIRFLALDVAAEPFDAAGVRRAIAVAVDRDALVEDVLSKTASPLDSLLPDHHLGHASVFEDLEGTVGEHLADAGVPSDERLSIDLWYTPSHYGESEDAVAQAIAEMLEATGRFDVIPRAREWAAYRTSLDSEEFGMYLLGWFPDVLHPLGYLEPFLRSTNATALGSNYASEEVDALLDEARTTTDPVRFEEALVALQERLVTDVPYVPLWQPHRIVGARTGVRGLTLAPSQRLELDQLTSAN